MFSEWRDVPGYEGVYEISLATKEGLCRNKRTSKILSVKPDKRGRIYWRLSLNNKAITHQAARWIALTYPELVENEYFEGAQIDHKDTDRLNNQPSNLRWVTNKENCNNPLTLIHTQETHRKMAKYPELIGLVHKDRKEYCRKWREITGYTWKNK